MTLQHDRPTTPRPVNRLPITTGKVHVDPPVVDNAPPTRSKVTAAIAGLTHLAAAGTALPVLARKC
jgi:hypothetical protein